MKTISLFRFILLCLCGIVFGPGLPYPSRAQAEDSLSREKSWESSLENFGRAFRENLDLEVNIKAMEDELKKLDLDTRRFTDSLNHAEDLLAAMPPEPKLPPASGKKKKKQEKDSLSPDSLNLEKNSQAERLRYETRLAYLKKKREDWLEKREDGLSILEKKENQSFELQNSREKNDFDRSQLIQQFRNQVKEKKGGFSFRFLNCRYLAYITEPGKDSVRMHWINPVDKAPYEYLTEVKTQLESKKNRVMMLTNAGMYTADNAPKGLFVAEGKVGMALDTLPSHPREPGVNFYLQPNGVFWLDGKGKAHIERTSIFAKNFRKRPDKKRYPGIVYATQSGPLLVHGGMINANFGKRSGNAKIRSGVGILPNGALVFLCTEGEENFFNFSSVFRDIFGCRDALFLDGAISRMFLPGIQPQAQLGPFGPIISITR
jgi:uncharacterized protein YigE (DUF2233 family)